MYSPLGLDERDVLPQMLDTPYGSADWVSLSTFFQVFLPPMPASIEFESLMRRIARPRAPARQIITKGSRLWGYSRKHLTDFDDESPVDRADAFKHLYTCANRLAKALPLCTQKYQMHHNEKNAWYPRERRDGDFPDAYLCRVEDNMAPPTWETIAVSGAYVLDGSKDMAEYVCFLPSHDRQLLTSFLARIWRKSLVLWPSACLRIRVDDSLLGIRLNIPT